MLPCFWFKFSAAVWVIQCFQAQEVLMESGPCTFIGCWLNLQVCRADCTMPSMYTRNVSTGGLGNPQEWRWGAVLGLVLHRLRGTRVSADGRDHPADPHTLNCKYFSSLHSPWDNFIIHLWSHRYTISPFLLISHNYNIGNADDCFDIHKNIVLISTLIAWSKKPVA